VDSREAATKNRGWVMSDEKEQSTVTGAVPLECLVMFVDFFDEYNIEHLAAYKYLSDNGYWPKGFIPENCHMPPTWPYQAASKLASAYVKLGMSGQVFGMPPSET